MTSPSDPISIGSLVELELVDRSGNKERLKIVIVEDNAADYSHGFLSETTPLARALLGERAGSTIPYLRDDIFSIEILSVSLPDDHSAANTATTRKARMEKTIREIEDTNAMVFASSFSGKWGDYDPDSIPKDEKEMKQADMEENSSKGKGKTIPPRKELWY
jgi:hypothetical protein